MCAQYNPQPDLPTIGHAYPPCACNSCRSIPYNQWTRFIGLPSHSDRPVIQTLLGLVRLKQTKTNGWYAITAKHNVHRTHGQLWKSLPLYLLQTEDSTKCSPNGSICCLLFTYWSKASKRYTAAFLVPQQAHFYLPSMSLCPVQLCVPYLLYFYATPTVLHQQWPKQVSVSFKLVLM